MRKKQLKYRSAFDIIGPIMIGPSSSHTAGVVKIGQYARALFQQTPRVLTITFYGSFAATYQGHGTALAIVAGVLGYETDDERIPKAIRLAKEQGMTIDFRLSDEMTEHANTIRLELEDHDKKMNLVGISIGGGSIQIVEVNGINVKHAETLSGLLFLTKKGVADPTQHIENALANASVQQVQTFNTEHIYYVQTTNVVSHDVLDSLKTLPSVIFVQPTVG